jgi:hypothetical protein
MVNEMEILYIQVELKIPRSVAGKANWNIHAIARKELA